VTGTRLAALSLVLGALACQKTSNNNPPMPGTGTGGGHITGGAGTGGNLGMVVVEVQSPTAGVIAPAGSLLDVTATARMDQGNDFIDPTSVEAVVTLRGKNEVLESTKLAPQGADAYSGRISLGDRETGDYTLTVSATSAGGLKGSFPVDFQIDGGPLLAVVSPQPFHSYKGLLVIEVIADAGIFPALDGPHATVANYDVPLALVGDPSDPNNHTYRGMINLRDPMPPMILPPLVDEQLLTVWATNGNGKRTEIHMIFVIDEEGPTITSTTPQPGEIVGDIMRISATVTDPAGVLDASVIAVIGDDTTPAKFNVQLKPDGLGVYSIFFDTRKLTGCDDPPKASDLCIVYPTISFRASDELNNERVVAYNFTVDNIAPVADLDPPNLRSFRVEETYVCSWEFDPLSRATWTGTTYRDAVYPIATPAIGDMPNDGTRVAQVFDLRARIEDDGNHAVGLKLTPISLVDPDKTAVYVLDDESQALIVDTDGDGWCDAINPLLVPTTEPPAANNQVLKIRLAGVPPAGVANFMPDPSLPAPPISSSTFCRRGGDPALPDLLCPGHQPFIAISYAGNEPAIWTLQHIDVNWCFGEPFDTYANNISPGWACIAIATTDFSNNSSVSAPLRVDIKYDGIDEATGRLFPYGTPGRGTPPACTGTWDRTTNMVTNGPCKTRRFERQPDLSDYYCYKKECPGPALPL
jgi:hypothetical protein